MERIINLHIERLPEGVYLATSDDVQGLLAQGSTVQETIEIAQDLARLLLEMDAEAVAPRTIEKLDLPIVLAA